MQPLRTAPRLVYVVTHPVSAHALLRGQLAFMRERGYDVSLVCAPGPELEQVALREQVRVVAVPLHRPIRPAADARGLSRLIRVVRELRPDIVNASTPKAGLLGMLAARALDVRVRVYLLRGLRLETTRGALRTVLGATERIASACATDVVCVSESLRDLVVSQGFAPARKARLVGGGSSNGVDVARFDPTPHRVEEGRRRASELGIAADAPVVGFVGRLDPDKGISELVDAMAIVRQRHPTATLLVVGAGLAGDADERLARKVREADRVVVLGPTSDLAPLYARMDVLAFPSFREGFPNVPLEAAAARVPVVGFRSTGVVDAVASGLTGRLVQRGSVAELAAAIADYLDRSDLRRAHGEAGRRRVLDRYTNEAVWNAWDGFYRARLEGSRR